MRSATHTHFAYIHVPKRWNKFDIVCDGVGFENLGAQRLTFCISIKFHVLAIAINKLPFIEVVGTLHEINQRDVHNQSNLSMEFNIWGLICQ